MVNIRRALQYVIPYWRLALGSVVITILTSVISLASPWPLQILLDNVLSNHPLPDILKRFLGAIADSRYWLLGLAVLAGLAIELIEHGLSVISEYVHTKLEQQMVLDIRGDLFEHAQRLSLAFHDEQRSGQILYAINSLADRIAALVLSLPPLVQSGLTLLGMFWITFTIDGELALVSLIVVPFLYYSVQYYSTHIQDRLRQVKLMEGETLSIIHEAMTMLRVIVAFGREHYEYKRFREQGERALDARVKLTVRQTLFSLAVNMTTAIGTALVLGLGAYHVLEGRLTVGQLLVVLSYIAAVYQPLQSISSTIGGLQDDLISVQMAFGLLDTQPDVKDLPGAVDIRRAAGHIKFERVHFSYNRRSDTLKDISFEVQPGQMNAIVGPTGAGKSTLVSLMPRFYDPIHGRILLDGMTVRDITLRSLRQQMSIVLQEPLLFGGTIADNIRYGRLEAREEEIIEAAKAANAHDFIMALPQQYSTPVGERGARLSGGERQRICIARAFLKDAPILILDEPTSSVDSKTEAVILEALQRLMVGRTTFMVAHRLSTIRHADRILVLNHGEPNVPRKKKTMDWDTLLEQAGDNYRGRSNSNPFGIENEEWVLQYSGDILQQKNILTDKWFLDFMAKSKGWNDLDLLLKELKELGAQPLLLSAPIPGPFYDYLGVSAAARQTYYEKLPLVVKPYTVPLLEFADHDGDNQFLIDPLFHLSPVGWVYYAEAIDSFYHGTLLEGR